MERSGSQKALLVFSIIEIIGAVLVLFGAISTIALTGMVGVAGSAVELDAETAALGASVIGILSIILVISGVWSLLCGIFGIRAANDNQKIMIVWVFILIDLVLSVVGIIVAVVNGGFSQNALSLIVSLIMSVIMFVIANNIKKEAGK